MAGDTNTSYHPSMDDKAHEATYTSFVHLAEVGAVTVACWVVALAVGGVKGAWTWTLIGILLSFVAAGIGGASKSIGWRAPAAVLAMLLVMLAVY